jgi:hypothetical protein
VTRLPITLVAAIVALTLWPSTVALARSPIRVGIGDQSPTMFSDPAYRALGLRITRYFVASDVMRDSVERARARAFVQAARAAGVSTLLHISSADLRPKQGRRVSTTAYARDVGRIVRYFHALGVRDFGAWNEVNHKTQETWDSPGHAVSYFKSMYRAVKTRCRSCAVVGLDLLDQAGVDRYIRSFYGRLSSTWRARVSVVGIHNYSDTNRNRTRGTRAIITTVRRYNRRTQFWFTETGALASFMGSFPYSEARQASRLQNMFTYASRYRASGVRRIYSYNWFGVEQDASCGLRCAFDAGLVRPGGTTRPAYDVFRSRLGAYSR